MSFADNFADAVEIDVSGGSVVLTGNNVGSTAETGDPFAESFGYGTHTVWAKFTATETGDLHLSTEGTEIGSVIGVFTGTWPSLTDIVYGDQMHPDDAGGYWSEVTLSATEGETYYVEIGNYFDGSDDYGPLEGAITLNVGPTGGDGGGGGECLDGEWLEGVSGHPASSDETTFYSGDNSYDGMIWSAPLSGSETQSVELDVTNANPQLADYSSTNIRIELRREQTLVDDEYIWDSFGTGLGAEFQFYNNPIGDPPNAYPLNFVVEFRDDTGSPYMKYEYVGSDEDPQAGISGHWAWPYGSDFTVRMESDPDGAFRILVNGDLFFADTVPDMPVRNSNAGFLLVSSFGEESFVERSPHINVVGCVGGDPPGAAVVAPGVGWALG